MVIYVIPVIPVIAQVGANPPYDEDASGEDVALLEHVQWGKLLALVTLLVSGSLLKDHLDLIDLFNSQSPLVLLGNVEQHVLGLLHLVVLS